jgi:hypothetical protein
MLPTSIKDITGKMDGKRKLAYKDMTLVREAQIIANMLNWVLEV